MRNDYEIRGETTAIFLRRRDGSILETIIDTSDLSRAQEMSGTWYVHNDRTSKTLYVYGHHKENGKSKSVKLHRWLLNPPKNMLVDHIDFDGLINTRNNLRVLTMSQNKQNQRGPQSNTSSGIRGVTWKKKIKRWVAQFGLDGKNHYVGCFTDIKEAEKAIVQARKKYMPFSQN